MIHVHVHVAIHVHVILCMQCAVLLTPCIVTVLSLSLSLTDQEIDLKSVKLAETESLLSDAQQEVKELLVPPPDVPGADRHELLRLLDRRQHEITMLSDEWRSLSSKLEITAAKKSEFQTK